MIHIIDTLKLLILIPATLYLPGYLCIKSFFNNEVNSLLEQTVFSIVLSLIIVSLFTFFIALTGITITQVVAFVILVVINCLMGLVYYLRK